MKPSPANSNNSVRSNFREDPGAPNNRASGIRNVHRGHTLSRGGISKAAGARVNKDNLVANPGNRGRKISSNSAEDPEL